MTIRPSVSLGTFGDFVVASSSAKIAVVRGAVELYNRDYVPGRDFYKGWRDAFVEAVPARDYQLRLHRAAAHAAKPRPEHYAHLTAGLLQWSARKHLTPSSREPQIWQHAKVDVRVRIAAQLKDGPVSRDLALYLKETPLTKDAADAMLRILELTNPSVEHGVLDVRRAQLYRPRRNRSQHFDTWLTSEAGMFAAMWSTFSAVA